MNHRDTCLEPDVLVDLCVALEWRTGHVFAHVAQCSTCREQLGRLEDLHGILDEARSLAPGFAADVMASVQELSERGEAPRARAVAPDRVAAVAASFLNPVLAAFTAFVALVAASAGQGPPQVSDALLALGVGLGTFLWNRRHPHRSQAFS